MLMYVDIKIVKLCMNSCIIAVVMGIIGDYLSTAQKHNR